MHRELFQAGAFLRFPHIPSRVCSKTRLALHRAVADLTPTLPPTQREAPTRAKDKSPSRRAAKLFEAEKNYGDCGDFEGARHC
jgi:hypothetical protein